MPGELDQKRLYHTDRYNYTAPDSGCIPASVYLGKQSSCLNCPFPECISIMTPSERNRLTASIYRQPAAIYRQPATP